MSMIWIKELIGGLDTRRLDETTPGGVLVRAKNGHITRGGEFEVRADFVPEFTLPPGTVDMAASPTGLVVFGSAADPGMPVGVTYQRLQHVDGTTALTKILSVDLFAGKLYVAAEFADGTRYHFNDGTRVTDWVDGRARASFTVTGGTGSSQLTDLKVNGVTIISAAVTWATSNEATAAAIASNINAHTSSPEYTATAVGARVNIIADTPGAASNGFALSWTLATGLVLTPSTPPALAGGQTVSGSFQPGGFVRTIGTKMHALSDSNLHFSGIFQPSKWKTDAIGAGFIDLSTHAAGSEDLTAIAEYSNLVAIFSEQTIQIWFLDPDPALNRKSQVLKNTGTKAGRSVVQFGDNDLYYLDISGVRSMRARDSSNAAATNDIGVAIDTLIQQEIDALTDADQRDVSALIEPRDKRLWLIIKGKIYVFSYFPGSKVSAWSTYEPGFTIDRAVNYKNRTYIRSGNVIYSYGGRGASARYSDDFDVEAWLPYLDANEPTREKDWTGVDAAVRGSWRIDAAMDVTNTAAYDTVGTIFRSTFGAGRVPLHASSTHLALRFTRTEPGYAKIGSAVIHYVGDADED